MKKIWYCALSSLCLLIAGPSALAQSATGNFYSLSDLKTLFVDKREGFIFTDEGFRNSYLGTIKSLKITAIDTVNGVFAGILTASQPFITNIDTQGVYGTMHLGETHGGSWMWLDFTYSDSVDGGVVKAAASFTAGVQLYDVGTAAPSGFIAGIQSEQVTASTTGFQWTNQPFSGVLTVLPK